MKKSASGALQWKILEPFGVEVEADLSKPLSAEDAALFRTLFYDNNLLIARKQKFDMEQQIRVIEYIGRVLRTPETVSYISTDNSIGALGNQELQFHSDIAWLSHPRRVGSLHAVDVQDGKSYTAFANSMRAYSLLPAAIKEEIAYATALQLHSHYAEGSGAAIGREIDLSLPHAWHPLVMTHPVTGRPILYISEMDTIAFEGIDKDRMVPLGKDLLGRIYDSSNIYRHDWHMGDFVIWDNLALQHARGDVSDAGTRTLQRVAIGDRSMAQMDARLDVNKNPKVRDFLSNAYGNKADDVKIDELAS